MGTRSLKKRRVEYEIEGDDDIDCVNNSSDSENEGGKALNDDDKTPNDDIDTDDSEDQTSNNVDIIICRYCMEQRTFDSTRKLTGHILDSHTVEGVLTLSKSSVVIVRRDSDGLFRCKKCRAPFESKSSFRKHLLKFKQCKGHYTSNLGHVTDSPVAFQLARPPPTWHTYNEALLRACNIRATSEEENHKELFYSERMGQFPIGMSIHGTEFNAVVSRTIYNNLPPTPVHALVKKSEHPEGYLPPWKLKESEQSSPALGPIEKILKQHSYASIVNQRRFTEMTKSVSEMLNIEWERTPQAGQIVTAIMAGSILFNPRNEEVLLVNEVEAYGRGRVIDNHCAKTGLVKEIPRITSMPKTTKGDCYFGVHPATISEYDGKRLEIGTFKSDILVTSCLRLDIKSEESVSVGGMTHNFNVWENDSKELRIFLDEDSLDVARTFREMEYTDITKNMGTEQLRQIRKNFHLLDSFELSRCSGPLTDSSQFRPVSVFTYANHCGGEGAGFGAGLILNRIGQSVINEGENGVLKVTDVKLAMKYCKNCKKTSPILDDIIKLFHGVTQIEIIGNLDLNSQLEKLADGLTSKISKLNATKKKEIMKLFGI